MRIMSNMASLLSYNAFKKADDELSKRLRRLSSGLRIEGAADDAAGLAISERLRAQGRGLDQAVGNAQDGMNLLRTAEGALDESHSILQRMRELAVQAANDVLTSNDRKYIQDEIDQLREELDRIAGTTQFNKRKLLDGSAALLWSTSDLDARVLVREGALARDAFGQRMSVEGNYVLSVEADPGQAQILKSNIFTINPNITDPFAGNSSMSVDALSAEAPDAAAHDATGTGSTCTGSIVAASGNTLYQLSNFWDKNGRFLLEDPQTISICQGDGRRTSFTIYKHDTLADLGEKISRALAEGLGQPQVSGGGSHFVGSTGTVGPEPEPSNDIQRILYGLKHGWLEMSERRIHDYYGFDGTDLSLTVKIYDKAPYGILAAIAYNYAPDGTGINHQFYIDLEDFKSATMPSGDNIHIPTYDDRIVAHEMAHAVMSVNMDWASTSTWFKEGSAEFIHGRNEWLKGDIDALIAAGNTQQQACDTIMASIGGPWTGTNANYSAAYVAVRRLHEVVKGAGGAGIRDIMADLKGGATLDAAIAARTGGTYASEAAFLAYITGAGAGSGGGYLDGIYGTLGDDADTGAVGGKDVDGGPVLSAQDVIDESLAVNSGNTPLQHWSVVWPTDTKNPAARPWFDPYGRGAERASATYFGISPAVPGTMQSVNGTLVLHSAITGRAGELHFTGDEAVLQALGFNEIQSSSETRYRVRVDDAHSGRTLQSGVEVTGPLLAGIIGDSFDVVVAPTTGIAVSWSDAAGKYFFEGGSANRREIVVHIADRTTVFQIGANEGEEMAIHLGDMSVRALGVGRVSVVDRESAGSAISTIDRAIDRVSRQRARIGAWENRLTHTAQALVTASENTQSAESRIRDLDMAREMTLFMRTQILVQASQFLMSQANQLTRPVLDLLRA